MFYVFYTKSRHLSTSTKGQQRLSAKDRNTIKIPWITFRGLYGLMLSDLHASQRSPTSNTRLSIGLSTKTEASRAFFDHVLNLLQPFSTPMIVPHIKEWVDKRSGVKYLSNNFATIQLPCFNVFRTWFYDPSGYKAVPYFTIWVIDKVVLAYIIMGDGGWDNNGLVLSCPTLRAEDQQILITSLSRAFHIDPYIRKTVKGDIIRIKASDIDKIRELLRPHVIKEMWYKIDRR